MIKDNGDPEVPDKVVSLDPEEPSYNIVPGGPLDCQDCGGPMGRQLAMGVVKRENGKMYVAGICPECTVARLGLEWREMVESTIVMPPGMKPS